MTVAIRYPYSVNPFVNDNSLNEGIDRTIMQWRSNLAEFVDDYRPLQHQFIDAWQKNNPRGGLPSLPAIDDFRREDFTWGISLQAFLLAHPVADIETATLKRAIIGAFHQIELDQWSGETWLEHVMALRRYPASAAKGSASPFDTGAAKLMVDAIATVITPGKLSENEEDKQYLARIYNSIADAIAGEVDGSFAYKAGIDAGRNFFPLPSRNIFREVSNVSVGGKLDQWTPCEVVASLFEQQKKAFSQQLILLSPDYVQLAQKDILTDADFEGVASQFKPALYELIIDRHIRAEYQTPIDVTRHVVAAIKDLNLPKTFG